MSAKHAQRSPSSTSITNKNNNKQVVNLVLSDLLRRHKKKKRKHAQSTQPRPEGVQSSQLPQPETLDIVAKRIPPNIFPPTNVITVNPAGLPTPTMFDVQRQQQLNAYDNLRDSLHHEISNLRMDLANYVNNGGDPATAQQMDSWLQQYQPAFDDYYGGINDDVASVSSTLGSLQSEYPQSDDYSALEYPQSERSVGGAIEYPSSEYAPEDEQPSQGVSVYDNDYYNRTPMVTPAKVQPISVNAVKEESTEGRALHSRYNTEIPIEAPQSSISTDEPSTSTNIRTPEYTVVHKVNHGDEGPVFSKDPDKNTSMVKVYHKDLDTINQAFDDLPLKGGVINRNSREWRDFQQAFKQHLYSYQNAYMKVLQGNTKQDKKDRQMFEDLAQNKPVRVMYPTFKRLARKLNNILKRQ